MPILMAIRVPSLIAMFRAAIFTMFFAPLLLPVPLAIIVVMVTRKTTGQGEQADKGHDGRN